jgi:hypothetical protein
VTWHLVALLATFFTIVAIAVVLYHGTNRRQ